MRNGDPSRFEHLVCYVSPPQTLEPAFRQSGFEPVCLHHAGPLTSVRTLFRLLRLVRERGVDVVHTHSREDRFYGQAAALLTGLPAVNTLHGQYSAWRYRISGKRPPVAERCRQAVEFWVERRTVRHVIAVSDELLGIWKSKAPLPGRFQPGLSVVRAAISPAVFEQEDPARLQQLREELDLGGRRPVLVTTGRLTRQKGQQWLVPLMERVLEEFPRAVLLIAGDGSMRRFLEEQIEKAGFGSAVRLLGFRSDVPALLALADLFVFTSLSEGTPLAVLEAMAAAKPVASFELGGLDGFIENGRTGWQVPPGGVQALAAKALEILKLPDGGESMGREARRIVRERLDPDQSKRQLEAIYRSALASPRCRPLPGIFLRKRSEARPSCEADT